MSQKEQYYDLQPSFNSGEISPDVANRTDLDKYKSALLTARNAYVRPYGAVYSSLQKPSTQTRNVSFMNLTTTPKKATCSRLAKSISGYTETERI